MAPTPVMPGRRIDDPRYCYSQARSYMRRLGYTDAQIEAKLREAADRINAGPTPLGTRRNSMKPLLDLTAPVGSHPAIPRPSLGVIAPSKPALKPKTVAKPSPSKKA